MVKFSMRMILLLAFALALFGIIIISHAAKAQPQGVLPHYLMQSIFLGVGLVGAIILYNIDYHFYKKPAVLWTLVGMILLSLLLVLVPGIGKAVKGSQRWIGVGPINLQPVEFVKVLIVVLFSAYLDLLGGLINRIKHGVIFPLILLGGVLGLLILQPDFGGAAIVCFLAGLTMAIGGVGFLRCASLALITLSVIVVFIALNPNRMKRLQNDSEGQNYQATQSGICFTNGGTWGTGLGDGMQKERFLPEPHTDFIFAIVGEDLGLVGTGAIWGAFILILAGGSVIAFRAKDKQGMLLAFGATMVICVQSAANMAVVTHVFPTKGLALPFLSYGGSCMLSTFAALGLLLSVGRSTAEAEDAPEVTAKRLVHWD